MAEAQARGAVSAQQFRDVIGCFASGVTVITTVGADGWHGATASAVSSLSLEPPMVLICLNQQSGTARAISEARRFVINILCEDQPDVAQRFASRGMDKFAGLNLDRTAWGAPVLADALAQIDCRVVEAVEGGTHWVFLASVEAAARTGANPLAYFRGRMGRLETEQDEVAYHAIRQRLLQRSLPTGVPLEMGPLAEALGVPRSSVYYGLARCAQEGFVERTDGPAFVLPPVTIEALLDALTALFGIWLGAIQLRIGTFAPAEIAELWRLVERLRLEDHRDSSWSAQSFLEARAAFVNAFLRASGSTTMVEAFAHADIRTMVDYCWSGPGALRSDEYEAIYQGFVDVMQAVARSDGDAATQAIRRMHRLTEAAFRTSFDRHQSVVHPPLATGTRTCQPGGFA